MKSLFYFIISVISLFLVFSCNDEITDISTPNAESLIDQAKSKILAMGLDTTDIMDIDDYFVVENDILINKDSLLQFSVTRQYSTTNTVATGQRITIGVDDSKLLDSWASALQRVAFNYSYYTGLELQFNGYDPDADIVISKEPMMFNSRVCAEGEFPVASNGKPGKHVRINSMFYKDIDTFLSYEEKEFLMMHEIGHNLGLRHTDCAVNGEGAGNVGMVKIPGTPNTDSNSYMNSGTCGYSWKGMSEYDAVALKYLFPVVYCTIHFENCTGISDIKFKKGKEYELSRTLIPKKDGYLFTGWHHVENVYTPFSYNYKIKDDKTLYARWTKNGILKEVKCTTYNGENTQTFELYTTSVVTFTSQVNKALNTWSDLRLHNGTYSKLERIDDSYDFSVIIDMRGTGEMDVINNPPYAKHTEKFVLESGKYMLISSLTTELGEQNWGIGNHGSVESTISYY